MPLSHAQFEAILAEEELPAALIDLDALHRNRDALVARLTTDCSLRIASKSIRCVPLLRRLLEHPRIQGLMTYSASETRYLASQGFTDLFLAYPVARRPEAALLAEIPEECSLLVAVDDGSQLAVLDQAAQHRGRSIRVAIDVDASWRPLGQHFGVRRSPIRTPEEACRLAEQIASHPTLQLAGVLVYEAQVAGMQDENRGSRHLDPVRRWIKARSIPHVSTLRAAVVDALRADGHLIEVVNGGGTGSLDTTSAEAAVTEVTAGSGFLCPHLFDGYRGLTLEPAAFFALPVVRASDPDFVTAAGGGFLASGPGAPDRAPIIHSPTGLEPTSLEGWGEVQTPFRHQGTTRPGSVVIARHAKGGELAERFGTYLLLEGGEIRDRALTYRGQGWHCP